MLSLCSTLALAQAPAPRYVDVTLKVDYADLKVGDQPVHLRTYNGQLMGPTLRVRPGDVLRVKLINAIDERKDPEPAPCMPVKPGEAHSPCGFNRTNLHTHGLHVSPSGNSDNVLLDLGPGDSFDYEYVIPQDHPAGTFWYHAHRHGSTAIQLASGMAGALIVEGKEDHAIPALRPEQEELLLFQQIPYICKTDDFNPQSPDDWKCDPSSTSTKGRVETFKVFGPGAWPTSGRITTINGKVTPTLTMRPGEVRRWRLINAGIREGLHLALREGCGRKERSTRELFFEPGANERFVAPKGLSISEIARDGSLMHKRIDSSTVQLYPGYRSDILVKADATPKCYELVDLPTDPCDSLLPEEPEKQGKVLAYIEVKGAPKNMVLPTSEQLAKYAPPLLDKKPGSTSPQQVIFNIKDPGTPNIQFLVNDRTFTTKQKPRQLTLGAVEEWQLSSQFIHHPFHIHVNPFQVTETLVNGEEFRYWKDTLLVKGPVPKDPGNPQGELINCSKGPLRVLTEYRKYIGQFVLHCHILDHEDQGMMELVEIMPPGGHAHSSSPAISQDHVH
ncbi:multicopper oxidase family protein [Archangium sp.]|uniref:multicopper oxidase family protein n=1 Tax=Archangium sp. TaxID=1872627 RepID=UPI002D777118|nr:multicopper oxidase family protein [Archangium sp.]